MDPLGISNPGHQLLPQLAAGPPRFRIFFSLYSLASFSSLTFTGDVSPLSAGGSEEQSGLGHKTDVAAALIHSSLRPQ